MVLAFVGFIIGSLLIFYHGRKLAFYGDLIAEKSGLGRVWVGLILMASVTSLPELVMGISAARLVGSADLAVGNVLGSCIFNLTILSLLDAILPGQPILAKVARSNVLAAALGTILLCFVGLGLFLPNEISVLNVIGSSSVAFIIIYFVSMRLLHQYGVTEGRDAPSTGDPHAEMSLSTVIGWYALHAVVVIGAAVVLPYFSEEIALGLGWGESFVGTLFLAGASSLPEIAVSIGAARSGNADMALGNLFGSNIFNIMLLAVSDIFYVGSDILVDASESNMVTVFAIIAMNSVAIAGLTIRPEKKRFYFLAWDTMLILVIYLITMIYLFNHR